MPEQIVYQLNLDAPVPGSFAATAAGCTCPPGMHQTGNVIYVGGYKAWRVTVGCPVHDAPPADDVLRLHDPAVLAAKLEQAQAAIRALTIAAEAWHSPVACKAEGEAESCPMCRALTLAQEAI